MILKKYLAFVSNPRYHRLYTLDKAGAWAIFALQDDKETQSSAELLLILLLIPLTEGFADCSLFEQFGKA
jgi:hypothetical protein